MASAATLEREASAGAASVTIDAHLLARAMASAAKVVEARNTIPILSNVRLVADPIIGKLEIVTTDLDVEYRQRLAISGASGPLKVTVNAGKLRELAGAVPKGAQMSLSLDAGRLVVKAGRGRWVIPTLPADDFPSIEFAPAHRLAIEPASSVAGILTRLLWSASTEAGRYYLSGPLWHCEGGKLRVVTTDGFTMPVISTDLDWPEGAPELILAAKFCGILRDLTADGAGAVLLSWDSAKIRAEYGDVVVTGKAIEGTFPDYRRLIIPPVSDPIIVDPATLAEAVRRVRLLGSEKTRSVKVAFSPGVITLSHSSPEHGTAVEDVPADCSAKHETGFNASYLIDMLNAIGGDSVEIHQQDPGAPTMFRRVVSDGALGIVMPMRV